MQIAKEDYLLSVLIDSFNEQSKNGEWDAAYGTSIVIAEHYKQCADRIHSSVVMPLRDGFVNRARHVAESRIPKKKR